MARRFTVEERRARLALRHHLAGEAKAADPVEVAVSLVGLHSSDPATVFLGATARMREPSLRAVEQALYDERALVRIHGMRRTLWALPVELAAIVQAACTDAIVVRERRRLEKLLADSRIPDGSAWFEEVARATLDALAARGEATGAELSRVVPGLNTALDYGPGRWGGHQPATSRVLFQLAAERRIARGSPRGSWTSSQYRWAPFDSWVPGGLAEWPVEAARAELARRWLGRFGPATVADLKWWTGWTLGETRRALAEIATVEVELEGGAPGLALTGDLEPLAAPDPWVALLPGLDPTAMGWKERDWYLGEHGPLLFDGSGNVGPTVWSEGRIAGGWAQRAGGEVVYRLLEDLGADALAAVELAAARLTELLAGTRVTTRFPTPLERELAA
jgi:winged helix DNA-binding protein